MPGPITQFNPAQDFQSPFDMTGVARLNQREQMRAAIHKDLDLGTQLPIPLTTTYFEGAFYLQDEDTKARKDLGAVRWAAPVIIEPSDDKKTIQLRLIRDSKTEADERFKALEIVGNDPFKPCDRFPPVTVADDPGVGQADIRTGKITATSVGSPLPGDYPGVIHRGSEELSQHILLHPSWANVTISAWRDTKNGPTKYSTRMADIKDDKIHPHRIASYHSAFKVEDCWFDSCGIGLYWGVDSKRPDIARGLFQSDGPFGLGSGTDGQALGYVGESGGGPIGAGVGGFDKHFVGPTKDGGGICQGHLWLGAPWFLDVVRDAPPEVYLEPYVKPHQRAGVPWATELRYDPLEDHRILGRNAAGGFAPGLFRWETFVPVFIPEDEHGDPEPPKEKPKDKGKKPKPRTPDDVIIPNPFDPTGPLGGQLGPDKQFPGGNGVGEVPENSLVSQGASPSRQHRSGSRLLKGLEKTSKARKQRISSTLFNWMETGFQAIALRPRQSQKPDLRYTRAPDMSSLTALEKDIPFVGRFDVIGAEKGSTWDYTQERQSSGRYKNGTASGSIWLMPPELDIDYLTRGEAIPSELSETCFGLWRSALDFGVPSNAIGKGSDGFRVSLNAAQDSLVFARLDPSGNVVADQSLTLESEGDLTHQRNGSGAGTGTLLSVVTSQAAARVQGFTSEGTVSSPTVLGAGAVNKDVLSVEAAAQTAGAAQTTIASLVARVTNLLLGSADSEWRVTTQENGSDHLSRFTAAGGLDLFEALSMFGGGGANKMTLAGTMTGARTATFQDASGTLAYTSDVQALTVTASSGTFAAVPGALHLVDTSGGTATCNLPAASGSSGRLIVVKDKGNAAANNITINRAGGDTIQGDASIPITADYGLVRLRSDGVSTWYLMD